VTISTEEEAILNAFIDKIEPALIEVERALSAIPNTDPRVFHSVLMYHFMSIALYNATVTVSLGDPPEIEE